MSYNYYFNNIVEDNADNQDYDYSWLSDIIFYLTNLMTFTDSVDYVDPIDEVVNLTDPIVFLGNVSAGAA